MFKPLAGDSTPAPVGFSAGLVMLYNQQGSVHVALVDGRLPSLGVGGSGMKSAQEAALLFLTLTGLQGRSHPLDSGVEDIQFVLLHEEWPDVIAVYGVLMGGRTSLLVDGAIWVPVESIRDQALLGLVGDVGRRL